MKISFMKHYLLVGTIKCVQTRHSAIKYAIRAHVRMSIYGNLTLWTNYIRDIYFWVARLSKVTFRLSSILKDTCYN